MSTPNTLTYERWRASFGSHAFNSTFDSGDLTTGRTGDAATDHAYELDLSIGSYAVQAHDYATQLTPERWFDAIRSGTRATGNAGAAPVGFARLEPELAGAL